MKNSPAWFITVALCLLHAFASAAPNYPVAWDRPHLDISVEAGAERHIGVAFTSMDDFDQLSLDVVPALAPYVTTKPVLLSSVQRGQPTPVWLRISVPDAVSPGVYEGTVKLSRGAKALASPLKIRLQVLSAATIDDPGGSGREITIISDKGLVLAEPLSATGILPPPGITLPFGLLSVRVTQVAPGSTVKVTVRYPTNTLGASVLKYINGAWIDISDRVESTQDRIIYPLVDGGDLDADGIADGIITDPVALASSITTYSSECNPVDQYASAAEKIGSTYQIPTEILKAIILQESSWRQFKCSSSGVKTPLVSGDGGIGLMQVTCAYDQCPQGRLVTDANGNTRIAIDTLTLTSSLKQKLRDDWQYNIEVGAKILLAKKGLSDASGSKDFRIIENWYYALARYNGYSQWQVDNTSYCDKPGPYNDPKAPCYTPQLELHF
ncbi:MAG: hypothetical protein IPO59_04890 [Betaproteobacteria bacterium]|nr:hypothetical protein [Betaproteobacteria bacterium]